MTQLAKEGRLDPVIGRGMKLNVLSKSRPAVPRTTCLIGEPGVGKTAIAEGLAQKIAADEVPELLRGKRVVTLI